MRLPAKLTACILATGALAACATTDSAADRSTASAGSATELGTPYASTYRPYPGRPTALVGATVFDGTGAVSYTHLTLPTKRIV